MASALFGAAGPNLRSPGCLSL